LKKRGLGQKLFFSKPVLLIARNSALYDIEGQFQQYFFSTLLLAKIRMAFGIQQVSLAYYFAEILMENFSHRPDGDIEG
jgi:hypothetical protein